jgi:hypothetical protein
LITIFDIFGAYTIGIGFPGQLRAIENDGQKPKGHSVLLVMDEGDLEVDDLFGDSGELVDASLDAALAGTSLDPIQSIQMPVRGLAQRVDDLHLSGCRQ